MAQYEYQTVVVNNGNLKEANSGLTSMLNSYGKYGWELVSSLTQPSLGSTQYSVLGISQKYTFIFKRQLESRVTNDQRNA